LSRLKLNKYPFLKDSTGNYKHLTTPASDAEAIAQLLEAHNNFRVKRFPASIINGKSQVDPDKSFKTEELEKAILDLFLPETDKPPETALLFFAGHGQRKQLRQNLTQGFLAASDVNPGKIWGFSLRDLWDILQQSQVKQQIIWLDCCFAGELLNFKDTELGRQSSGCDRMLIAASRDYEVAYLYRHPAMLEAKAVSEILQEIGERAAVLIVSDAGAARGNFDQERVDNTKVWIEELQQSVRYFAWLNPMPSECWKQTTAGEIARFVPR
jgi:Caspase domain